MGLAVWGRRIVEERAISDDARPAMYLGTTDDDDYAAHPTTSAPRPRLHNHIRENVVIPLVGRIGDALPPAIVTVAVIYQLRLSLFLAF